MRANFKKNVNRMRWSGMNSAPRMRILLPKVDVRERVNIPLQLDPIVDKTRPSNDLA
jgi:hypothetical protein